MDKYAIRRFKNRQRQLAKRIAKKIGAESYTVTFEQNVIGNQWLWDLGFRKYDKSLVVIPDNIEPSRKYRVVVYMSFRGKYDKKVVNRVLKKWHKTKSIYGGFLVMTSANMATISKF